MCSASVRVGVKGVELTIGLTARIADQRSNENIFPHFCLAFFVLFSQAARDTRCQARCLVCVRSIPPRSNISSSWLRTILHSSPPASGQRKRPFSRRLAHTQSPLPSKKSN